MGEKNSYKNVGIGVSCGWSDSTARAIALKYICVQNRLLTQIYLCAFVSLWFNELE